MEIGEKFWFKGYEWIVLAQDEESVTAMMAKPWKHAPFDVDKSNNWKDSSIRKDLYKNLLPALGDGNLLTHSTDLVADNGDRSYGRVDDRIWLISCDEFRRYRDIILKHFGFDSDFLWMVTPWYIWHDDKEALYPGYGSYIRYVHPTGHISNCYGSYIRYVQPTGHISNCYANCSYGVAPACIINRASLDGASADAQG